MSRRWRAVRQANPALLAFCALLVVAGIFYFVVARHEWFGRDDFEFLVRRSAGNVDDLLRPHDQHWVTLPVLVYRFLWWAVGIRSYLPYQALIIVLHLGVALLLWFVMRRAGVRAWTATIVGSVFVMFGTGWFNIVVAFQITLVGSMFFGLVFLLLTDHDGPIDRRDGLGMVAGLAALMCSGVGVVMVFVVGLAVLMRRGWRPALLNALPLTTIFILWWLSFHKRDDCKPVCTAPPKNVGDVIRFNVRTLSQTFRDVGQLPGLGVVVALMLVVGLVLAYQRLDRREVRGRVAAPLALLVGAFAFLLLSGIGRGGATGAPVQSRFEYIFFAMLVAALGVAVDAIMQRSRLLTIAAVVVLLTGVPGNIHLFASTEHTRGVERLAYRRMVLTIPRLAIAKQVPRSVNPDRLSLFLNVGWLLDGVAAGRIPGPPHDVAVSERALDTVRLSVRQRWVPVVRTSCRPIDNGAVLQLSKGQKVSVFGAKRDIRLYPAGAPPPDDAWPMRMSRNFGPTLIAIRPIAFRIAELGAYPARVCGAT